MTTNSEKSLKITGKNNKFLTKSQQKFNQLTQRVEKLEKEIIADTEKLNRLLEFHAKEIRPAQKKTAFERLNLAMALDKAANKIKFSKNQKEEIGEIICEQCDEAFAVIVPDDEQKALFDRWSEISFDEEMDSQKNQLIEDMEAFLKEGLGLDIDLNDIESPEGQERLEEKLKSEFEKKIKDEEEKHKNKKKSKKQISLEERQKEQDEIKNKNIRSIFYSLAKVLHPDLEQNPVARAEKEEIMKKVTVAYEQQDLSTLLKLELEWVHKETEHLELISEQKLKIYIDVLKEQVNELEREKYAIYHNPRFAEIYDVAHSAEHYAKQKLTKQKHEEKQIQESLKHNTALLSEAKDKKSILSFVKIYFQNRPEEESLEELMQMFLQQNFR